MKDTSSRLASWLAASQLDLDRVLQRSTDVDVLQIVANNCDDNDMCCVMIS
jgi:hypothetical protein